jgi:hypothetical protein
MRCDSGLGKAGRSEGRTCATITSSLVCVVSTGNRRLVADRNWLDHRSHGRRDKLPGFRRRELLRCRGNQAYSG